MKFVSPATLLVSFYFASCFALARPVSDNAPPFHIQWSKCDPAALPNLECGQVEVPLDWSNPHGPQITLGIMRIPATDPKTRIGSLMFNPGGPGGAATEFCEAQAKGTHVFREALTSHFDIVCPDPRGIGTSSPISCSADLWNRPQSVYPTDQTSYEKMVQANKAFGESCLELSGDIVKHVDTTSVARDIEAVRLGLKDGKLNWLGISYGTQIGQQYAELYPENIRTMALDGNVDHSGSESDTLFVESSTYENVLNLFFDWCNGNETCALHGQDVAGAFDDLVAKADKAPIPAPGCLATADGRTAGTCYPDVTGEDIRFNVQANGLLTYKNDNVVGYGWEKLGMVLNESIHGNATGLSSPLASNNNASAWQGQAVGCLDWVHSTTSFADNEYKQYMTRALAPHTKGASQTYNYQTRCVGWPAPVVNPEHQLNQTAMRLAPPILMVNALHDPESSYVWAQNVRPQISSAVLLTRNGDGHSSFSLGGEATAAIEAYLVNRTLPVQGAVVQS